VVQHGKEPNFVLVKLSPIMLRGTYAHKSSHPVEKFGANPASPRLENERKRAAEEVAESAAKRRKLPRGVHGVHSKDTSLVTVENAEQRSVSVLLFTSLNLMLMFTRAGTKPPSPTSSVQ